MRVPAVLVASLALGCGARQVPGRAPAAPTASATVIADGAARATVTADIDRADDELGPAYPRAVDGGLVWSRLPGPHRGHAEPAAPLTSIDAARRLVGQRDRRPPLVAALAWSSELTGRAAPAVTDAAALVAWAQTNDAWRSLAALTPGDLIVFDRAVGGAPASLLAVALGRDERGVVEFLYLGAGVVRRGFFDATRPRVVRDRGRRVVNTSLRHNRDQPPRGTRFWAGELFAGVISTAPR